ncbi:hypothetical protein HETIRDRAFT_427288 [Heterobasidion irregulare TC 32-1]|uniref:BTB domain-containing protein n=1 Tax=Heterobasidion irregulare (strain TC 32-1) TaxID=747525 RepID=W4K9Z2_HETIT|nr:uncharacterized protein HETIRDRAFT_427288 [Heterobasidion irregulare TC 32-1]ETW82165.1 hypothetical protein HETIRDRAFT_427288 [Heterobasidion irregulare TC 32-1]
MAIMFPNSFSDLRGPASSPPTPEKPATHAPCEPTEPSRDTSFYLETVVFLAENTLFRVPRYRLEAEEGVFAGMFSMPQGEKAKEGSSDTNPIILPSQVTAFEFKSFMKAIYPTTRRIHYFDSG